MDLVPGGTGLRNSCRLDHQEHAEAYARKQLAECSEVERFALLGRRPGKRECVKMITRQRHQLTTDMNLQQLLNQITPLPWTVQNGETLEVGPSPDISVCQVHNTDGPDDQPAGERAKANAVYIAHAAKALPELLAAAKNLGDNWGHNLTEPMARLTEAIELADEVRFAAPQ
ncbi:MAG: hypothetical protein ACREIC_21765 [Limisphaerales bacterium]